MLLAVTSVACSRPGPDAAAQVSGALKPNVLVVVIDALRWDHLGVNGDPEPTTPCIDSLAAQGVSLEAFAHSTWTKPSIATLFTSLYPTQHGIWRVGIKSRGELRSEILRTRWTTLAERFHDAGWATGAAVNQVHLSPRYHFDQGFERYDWVRGKDAFKLVELLLTWLREEVVGGERPYFAYLHALDTHWPYDEVLPGQEDVFGPVDPADEVPRSAKLADDWIAKQGHDEEVLAALGNRYDREVAYADRAICGLVEGLRGLGLWQDTVMLVTADHGEGFGERDALQHGYLPYDELMRVPMVLRLPEGLPRPVGRPRVGLIDVLPTLLELAGLPRSPHAQGMSFARDLTRASSRERLHFAETAEGRVVRSASEKVIRRFDGRIEHYDLTRDPGETTPLPCEESCRALLDRLDELETRLRATRDRRPETVVVDEDDLELLEALGYL